MAKFVWKEPYISINSEDLSDHVESLVLNYKAEIVDTTSGGDATRTKLAGLKDWDVQVTFKQDYAAGEVDATLFSLVGAAPVAIVMRPTTAAVGATNPSFSGDCLIESYPPLAGGIGEGAKTNVSIQGTDTLARDTS